MENLNEKYVKNENGEYYLFYKKDTNDEGFYVPDTDKIDKYLKDKDLEDKLIKSQYLLDSTDYKFTDDYDLKDTPEWLEIKEKRKEAREFIRENQC